MGFGKTLRATSQKADKEFEQQEAAVILAMT